MLDINYHIALETSGVAPRDGHQAARAALADIPLYLEYVQRFLDSLPAESSSPN